MKNGGHVKRPIPALSKKARFWKDHGYKVDEVGGEELAALLGTSHFGYGLVWREGGRLNPYLFTNGMVSAGAALGGRVFGDSPVQTVAREGTRWRVRTPKGSIRARKIIICTAGLRNAEFMSHGKNSSYPLVASALATKPLPPELVKLLMPSGAVIEQHPGLYHMLLDGRNRLISSTIPSVGQAYNADRYFSVFREWVNRVFPVSRDFKIELDSYWSGMMFNSSPVYQQGYPSVHDFGDGMYAFVNLGSWGNFMGPMLGKSLGQALAADRPDDFVLPFTPPRQVAWPGQFSFVVRRLGVPAGRLADRLKLI
jgi:glycine/D-amino acid oxidase-like deaminating enzyme